MAGNIVAADLNLNAEIVLALEVPQRVCLVLRSIQAQKTQCCVTGKTIDFYDTPSNDATANNSVLVVKINNHQLGSSHWNDRRIRRTRLWLLIEHNWPKNWNLA